MALKEDTSLIGYLAGNLGCRYLSDIKYLDAPAFSIYRLVTDIPADRYSTSQWLDAIDYLAGPCAGLESLAAGELKARLMDRLYQMQM